MKNSIKYIGSLLLLIAFTTLNAQVRVTGHVCAEVVEAVSLQSGATNLLHVQQDGGTENLDLGNYTLSGKSLSVCNVMVNSSSLTGNNGNAVSFNANPEMDANNGVLNQNGSQTFNIKGQAGSEIFSQNDSEYQAAYNVVFAYN